MAKQVQDSIWSEYQEEVGRFATRSCDDNGHRSEVRVNLPPDMVGMLQSLVEQRVHPDFKTKADILRAGLIEILMILENEDYLSSYDRRTLARERSSMKIEAAQREVREIKDLAEKSYQGIQDMVGAGDWESADQIYQQLLEQRGAHPERYKAHFDRMISKLQGEFGFDGVG